MARKWLVAAVLLGALAGCGDEPAAEPATVPVPATSSVAPAASHPAVAAGTAGFVAVVQRRLPEVTMDHRDEELAALARQACASLAGGRSAGAVVTEAGVFGTDPATARELVKLAIGTVCPEQGRRAGEF